MIGKELIDKVINLLKNCESSNDVPISAIILDDYFNVVAHSWNECIKYNNVHDHAEISVINKLMKKKGKNLSNYYLFTTLEPCLMCYGAIIHSKISRIYYIVQSNIYGVSNFIKSYKLPIPLVKVDTEHEQFLKNKLQEFFKNLR